MHEALLTRGDVQGLPFNIRVEIFCPQNCVILHQKGHFLAQHYERAKRIVARYLIRWNGEQATLDFLRYMGEAGATKALEVERQLVSWNLL
jgi:hypothetical protein